MSAPGGPSGAESTAFLLLSIYSCEKASTTCFGSKQDLARFPSSCSQEALQTFYHRVNSEAIHFKNVVFTLYKLNLTEAYGK